MLLNSCLNSVSLCSDRFQPTLINSLFIALCVIPISIVLWVCTVECDSVFVWYFFKQFSISATSISRSIVITRDCFYISVYALHGLVLWVGGAWERDWLYVTNYTAKSHIWSVILLGDVYYTYLNSWWGLKLKCCSSSTATRSVCFAVLFRYTRSRAPPLSDPGPPVSG